MTMQIISKQGNPEVAEVFVAKFRGRDDLLAEFVDARDPELPLEKKWVIIVSSQFGCPVACTMCDAGGDYKGDLATEEILAQIDHVISMHPADRAKTAKLKIQFARMGEPALNRAVLNALRELPGRYAVPGLIPCIATIAPSSSSKWFEELLEIRHSIYHGRPFQLQLSINSTDESMRDRLMPVPKISMASLGKYADEFYEDGMRKVGLNFALTEDVPIDPDVVANYFSPASCCIKITPLNPTYKSAEMGLSTALPPDSPETTKKLCDEFAKLGFDVILSIGDVRENEIGSNCGMAVRRTVTKRENF